MPNGIVKLWPGMVSTLLSFLMLSTANALPNRGGQKMQNITIARSGSQPSSQGQAEYFSGSVRVDPLFSVEEPSRMAGARVTFEPGARTAWHTHPLGQTLIVTAGGPRRSRKDSFELSRIVAEAKHVRDPSGYKRAALMVVGGTYAGILTGNSKQASVRRSGQPATGQRRTIEHAQAR